MGYRYFLDETTFKGDHKEIEILRELTFEFDVENYAHDLSERNRIEILKNEFKELDRKKLLPYIGNKAIEEYNYNITYKEYEGKFNPNFEKKFDSDCADIRNSTPFVDMCVVIDCEIQRLIKIKGYLIKLLREDYRLQNPVYLALISYIKYLEDMKIKAYNKEIDIRHNESSNIEIESKGISTAAFMWVFQQLRDNRKIKEDLTDTTLANIVSTLTGSSEKQIYNKKANPLSNQAKKNLKILLNEIIEKIN